METMTFVFVTDDHWSKSVVTAETSAECLEKYILKYPERKGDSRLHMYYGDRTDITPGFERM